MENYEVVEGVKVSLSECKHTKIKNSITSDIETLIFNS